MKRNLLQPVFIIFSVALILSSAVALGQPVRTNRLVTLYSQPSLKAPAPTYPPINSLLIIKEKAKEEFWKVLYLDNLLYMHESSLQYCVPADSAEENLINPMDSAFKNKLVVPWYGKRYGVVSIDSLSQDQCEDALRRANWISYPGIVITITGSAAIIGGCYMAISAWSRDTDNDHPIIGWINQVGDVLGGIVIICSGALIDIPGITLWSIGAGRKADIRKVMNKIPGKISLNPYVTNDFNHYAAGLTLTFTF